MNNNFTEITKEDWRLQLEEIRSIDTVKRDYYSNGQFDAIINRNTGNLYLRDNTEFKYYQTSQIFIGRVFYCLNNLQIDNLHIREGFVDKSFNTEIYSPFVLFAFALGPLHFKYEELKSLNDKIQNNE